MRSTKCGGQTPAWKRISALSIGIIWRRQTPRKMQLGMKSPIATSTKRAEWQTIAGARQISGFNLHCVPRAPVGCIRDFKSNYSRGRELYLPSGRAFSVFLFFSLSLLKSECPIYIFHKNWFQLKCPRRLPVPKGIYAWRWPLRPAVDWISFFLFYFQYVDVESVVKINKLSRSALLLFLCGFYPVFTPMSLGFHPLFFPWSSSCLISRLYTRREKRNDSGNRSSPTGKWVNKKKVFTIPPHWHIGQQVIICSFSSYFLTCPSLADVCAHTHNNLSWGDDESSHSRRRSKKNGIDSQERGLFQSHRVRSSLSNCRFSFCVLKARDPGTELENLAHWKSHIIASVGVVRAAHFHHPTL